jgi:3-keto-disaccharide hydrolase
MKNLFIAVLGVFLISTSAVFAQEKSLFNGEDLTGWTIYGTEKWFVEDGLLVCESGPDAEYGYLGTNEHYKDFTLTLEFKQEANGNSGVFIRSTIDGTKISGWQVEVAPPGHDTGGVYESYGRGWLIKPDPEKDKALKMGEWNQMKIQLNGDTLTSWLNGTQMVTITDTKIGEGEGSIALQIHSGGGIRVKWRNIKVTTPQ